MPKLLIIDDSLLTRNMLKRFLTESGYDVIEATDGELGLEMISRHRPDAVISDLLMPRMDGIELLKKLKEKGNTIPVIIFSANIQKSVAAQCRELGAADFFYKPPRLDNYPEKERFMQVLRRCTEHAKAPAVNISPRQVDVMTELINIGMGRAAASLNELLDSFITLQIPRVWVFDIGSVPEELARFEGRTLYIVRQDFNGPFKGKVALLFPPESAASLISALTKEEKGSADFDSVRAGTLCEVGNILINGVLGSLCNVLECAVDFSLPIYVESTVPALLDEIITRSQEKVILMAKTCFNIEVLKIEGHFLILLDTESFGSLMTAVTALEKTEA